MPYQMRKRDGYRVTGPSGVHAKHTTKAKAEAQVRLLRGIEHGMKPKHKKSASGSPQMTNADIAQGYKSLGGGIHD